jgi:hypothetical protein
VVSLTGGRSSALDAAAPPALWFALPTSFGVAAALPGGAVMDGVEEGALDAPSAKRAALSLASLPPAEQPLLARSPTARAVPANFAQKNGIRFNRRMSSFLELTSC